MKLNHTLIVSFCLLALGLPPLHAQSALNRAKRTAEYLEPSLPRPEQDAAVAAKLASLSAELGAHAATFKKYPPKKIGL